MKKPASTPRRRSKRPTLRFKLDGEWWIVKVQRPPSKELCEGMTDYRSARVVYFHPQALKGNLLGIVRPRSRPRHHALRGRNAHQGSRTGGVCGCPLAGQYVLRGQD
jgi:hypothetical protein